MQDDKTILETTVRRGFWDFCSEHPVAFVFAVVAAAWGAADVAQAISGNYPPDDGFWKYNGKASVSCTELMK